MKNNQNAKKEITRDVFIKIPLSIEEKALWISYAEKWNTNPTRLARNHLMQEAESIINNKIYANIGRAYIKYCEVTNNKEVLDRIKTD